MNGNSLRWWDAPGVNGSHKTLTLRWIRSNSFRAPLPLLLDEPWRRPDRKPHHLARHHLAEEVHHRRRGGVGEHALHLMRTGTAVDVLITDHLMPGMSGAELAREARVLKPGLPILIVSGYAEVEGLAPELPRLVRPFRTAELAERVVVSCLACKRTR